MSMDKSKIETMTFEGAIARLEEIVHTLEQGNAPLDDSLEMFEEGVALVKHCNGKLDTAQQKVTMLTTGSDGTVSEVPMPPMQS